MNKAKLKSYAPQARKDFIAAVVARANLLGISEKHGELEIAPSEISGDVTLIAGQAWPAKVHEQRERLIKRMQKVGAGETAEAIAYTWFNRFAALRYMEIHDYLGHGHRVLSSREGGLPEILAHATELAGVLPGLNATQIADMKLAGNKDGELYRLLLVAQCNALSSAMPFLFERIDDETELLLPDNLLRTDSIVAKLVEAIPEEDWAEVEVIGWLYQFYISEKKDQVIGKVVKSEDIPAATQLFTPNWIVQYLVQNSVGRLWLMANPESTLASEWPYYISPAEQTPEVQAQLETLIQTRVREDGDTLNPESITVLDPACGSGHILVVAYDVLKAIYLERGYQPRSIPRLILEKNLYGLDIDDRAAQMAGFALLMKARADDRRLFTATDDAGKLQPPKLNVLSLQESKGLSVDELATHLAPFKVQRATITALVESFEHAKTFGSLIQVPYALKTQLAVLPEVLGLVKQSGDIYASAAADDLLPLVQQAQMLAMQFDAVVANPPYMGSKGMNDLVKKFAMDQFPNAKSDLFAISTERFLKFAKHSGFIGLMTPFSWMFLKSYEALRGLILEQKTLHSLVQPEYHAFFDSAYVSVCTFVIQNFHTPNYQAGFIKLSDFYGADLQPTKTLEAIRNPDCGWFYRAKPDDFNRIPGSPLAFHAPRSVLKLFSSEVSNSDVCEKRLGLCTGDNDRFLRHWHEVSFALIGFGYQSYAEFSRDGGNRYAPHNKGGEFRRWAGRSDFVIKFDSDSFKALSGLCNRLASKSHYFRESLTWSEITSSTFSMRALPPGYTFNIKGPSIFCQDDRKLSLLAYFNSFAFGYLLGFLNQTISTNGGDVERIPFKTLDRIGTEQAERNAGVCLEISKSDLNGYETTWDFQTLPILTDSSDAPSTLESNYTAWIAQNRNTIAQMKCLEEENNQIFIDAYGLVGELSSDVPIKQITLTVNPSYRYGGRLTEDEQWSRFRQDTCQELISYAIGCMMGRYSLDAPGLIYANAGNVGFDVSRYKTFPADADGIVPITDELWFADDTTNRIREFLRAVWGPDTLEENMAWLAESLGTKATETPDETIRRYIADKFYKDHLQTYKKRPIYWLFSSGKQGAFQALVYLHRYSEGTLARLRAEYVVPLTGKMQSRIEMLEKDKDAASSTAARNKIAKQIESLKKKHVELLAYDEKLRHYADMRITLDLDDGVKVNYSKFGDLLAEVKAVTGGADDE
jgi:type II restriction/modification system DNA methylase subunit YeeA